MTDETRVAVTLSGPVEFLGLGPAGSASAAGERGASGDWLIEPAVNGGIVARSSFDLSQASVPSGRSLLIRPVDPGHIVHVDGRPYAGDLVFQRRGDVLTVINAVDLETYLRGVVPWEIGRPGEAGLAALEAQSVAARTYTVSHLEERRSEGFDVWADTRDQVYKGLEGTDAWCDLAIANTAGLVLRYGGSEIEAYYSSTCGGATSNIQEVWPRPAQPYLHHHDDRWRGGAIFCAGSSQFTWQEAWTLAEIEAALAANLPSYLDWTEASPLRSRWVDRPFRPAGTGVDPRRPGRLRDLRVRDRTSSGRVGILEVVTEAGTYRVRGDRVRWVLQPASGRFAILRSSWFDLELQRTREGAISGVRASGRGFGHGIGMCQTGALGMARAGADSRAILEHYYPGTTLEPAWER